MNVNYCAWIALVILVSSCNRINTDKAQLEIELNGLINLGSDFEYQGWLVVDGEPVTTGVISMDENGSLFQKSFEIETDKLELASAFVVTIEPSPDDSPLPSPTHVVAGDFNGNVANLSINHDAALGCNFSDATGKFVLATPTDGNSEQNEDSGLWFLDNSSYITTQGLDVPELPDGWVYEGWAVIDGVPVSTGTFRSAESMDDKGLFSGSASTPPFPGEDFLLNAPDGLEFPISLKGETVFISVEPYPDNSNKPYCLRPLQKLIPIDQETHLVIEMENRIPDLAISGKVTR